MTALERALTAENGQQIECPSCKKKKTKKYNRIFCSYGKGRCNEKIKNNN